MIDSDSLLVILGATATGKTQFAIDLAEEIGNVEIISADSQLVYKGFDIGTAKPSLDEMHGIPHHLIDVFDPKIEPYRKFSVGEFQIRATELIQKIRSRGNFPILVGGTGLYIQALIEGYSFAADGKKSTDKIFNRDGNLQFNAQVLGLTLRREEIYNRINRRVEKMFELGLIDEVQNLLDSGIPRDAQAMLGIGYREVVDFLDGKFSKDETIERIQIATRHYAKRQFTWFKRMHYINWTKPLEFLGGLTNAGRKS